MLNTSTILRKEREEFHKSDTALRLRDEGRNSVTEDFREPDNVQRSVDETSESNEMRHSHYHFDASKSNRRHLDHNGSLR
jgi:hypothetical protein